MCTRTLVVYLSTRYKLANPSIDIGTVTMAPPHVAVAVASESLICLNKKFSYATCYVVNSDSYG